MREIMNEDFRHQIVSTTNDLDAYSVDRVSRSHLVIKSPTHHKGVMPRTTLRGHRKEEIILLNGDDLEASIRALKAAKRADKKRQREETENDAGVITEAPATEAVPHEAVLAVQRVLDASNEFQVLNIPVRPATATATVRKAYRFVSLSVHPDKVGLRHPQANAAFLAVKSAMELLVNPASQEHRRIQIESAVAPAAEGAVVTEEAQQATDTEANVEANPDRSWALKSNLPVVDSYKVNVEAIKTEMSRLGARNRDNVQWSS